MNWWTDRHAALLQISEKCDSLFSEYLMCHIYLNPLWLMQIEMRVFMQLLQWLR
jgi:hypothetical protein